MADGVNNSSKKINGALSGDFAERERRLHPDVWSSHPKYAHLKENEEKLIADLQVWKDLASGGSTFEARDQAAIKDEMLQLDFNIKAQEAFKQSTAAAQNKQLAGKISTFSSERNINQTTTTMSGEARISRLARESPDRYLPEEIRQKRIKANITEASQLGRSVAGSTLGLGLDSPSEETVSKINRQKELLEQIAIDKRAGKIQNRLGETVEKRMWASQETLGGIAGVLKDETLKRDVASGKYGSAKQEGENLAEAFSRLEKAMKGFEDATESAEKDLDKYTAASKEFLDAQKGATEQLKIKKEVDKQGGDNGWNRVGQWAQIAKNASTSISGMMIDDEITNVKLRAATGQTAIDQYNRVGAAMGGDMRSLLAESGGQEVIKKYSDMMRSRKIVSEVSNIAIDSVGTVAKGMAVGAVATPLAGVAAASGDAMNVARNISQVAKGNPQTMIALEAEAAMRQAANVGNEMNAIRYQNIYNQSMAAWGGTIGGGSAGSTAEATLLDTHYLKSMAAQGMKGDEAARLTGMSYGALGNQEAATSVALKAAKAQATGIMSADQFIGMAGQLSSSGGGTADLETLMRNAVAGGFDSAKSVQAMVSATASLSSGMSKMGYNATGAAGNMMAAYSQDLIAGGMDKNLAMTAASSQLELRESMDSQSGLDIGSIYKFNKLKKLMPKASTIQLDRMSRLTPTELEAMRKNPELAKEMGLPMVTGQMAINVGEIQTTATGLSGGIGVFDQSEDDKRVLVNNMGLRKLENRVGKEAIGDPLADTLIARSSPGQAFKVQDANWWQKEFASGAALGGEGGIATALSDLATIMKTLSDNISAEKAAKNVETSMDDMKVVGPVLSTAASKLDGASDALVRAADKLSKTLNVGGVEVKTEKTQKAEIAEDMRKALQSKRFTR